MLRIARKLSRRVPSHMLELEDLVSVGMVGLYGALRTYDPSLGVPLRPYAIQRIAGEMIDAVRKADAVPHPTRRTLRQADRASEIARQTRSTKLSDKAVKASIAAELGTDADTLSRLRDRASSMAPPRHVDERVAGDEQDPLSLGDTISAGGDPLDKVTSDEEARGFVRRLLVDLTPLELQVALFFHVDKADTFWIAQRLGLSLMETWAIVGDVGLRLGARSDSGEPQPLTPKRGHAA